MFAAKVSAQSPPVKKNASPRETSASLCVNKSHSLGNTKGGKDLSSFTTRSNSTASGHSGCCFADVTNGEFCGDIYAPKNAVASRYLSAGTVFKTPVALSKGTRTIFVPCSATICP